jgi:hypothetical protein
VKGGGGQRADANEGKKLTKDVGTENKENEKVEERIKGKRGM